MVMDDEHVDSPPCPLAIARHWLHNCLSPPPITPLDHPECDRSSSCRISRQAKPLGFPGTSGNFRGCWGTTENSATPYPRGTECPSLAPVTSDGEPPSTPCDELKLAI